MATMKLSGEDARELAYGGNFTAGGLTVESDEQITLTRWTAVHQLVVKDRDGRLWAAKYERGLTGRQDTGPFDYQDEVEFAEVRKVPVTVYKYEPVASGGATADRPDHGRRRGPCGDPPHAAADR